MVPVACCIASLFGSVWTLVFVFEHGGWGAHVVVNDTVVDGPNFFAIAFLLIIVGGLFFITATTQWLQSTTAFMAVLLLLACAVLAGYNFDDVSQYTSTNVNTLGESGSR